MRADEKFGNLNKSFWAHVRSISEAQGYTDRKTKSIKTLNAAGIRKAFVKLGLSCEHLFNGNQLNPDGQLLCDYFEYRADLLNNQVQRLLMDAAAAEKLYTDLRAELKPSILPVMNKQKGDKQRPAYLTGIVNMLVEQQVGQDFDWNPGQLTTFTNSSMPLRTLSRRVDGAYPTVVNPLAIWEIKEYYHTTTFGSRVADGVYETLLDGMELSEMREHTGHDAEHVLILDAHFTWWQCGRSYLCRIIDMLNMGYVDEVIFGREVLDRVPVLAADWVKRKANVKPEPVLAVPAAGTRWAR